MGHRDAADGAPSHPVLSVACSPTMCPLLYFIGCRYLKMGRVLMRWPCVQSSELRTPRRPRPPSWRRRCPAGPPALRRGVDPPRPLSLPGAVCCKPDLLPRCTAVLRKPACLHPSRRSRSRSLAPTPVCVPPPCCRHALLVLICASEHA